MQVLNLIDQKQDRPPGGRDFWARVVLQTDAPTAQLL
jgi:hypothetical protein